MNNQIDQKNNYFSLPAPISLVNDGALQEKVDDDDFVNRENKFWELR